LDQYQVVDNQCHNKYSFRVLVSFFSSIQSAITKALQQQELRHNQETQLAAERYNKLQDQLELQQQEFLKQREHDNEQRREEARSRREEQEQQVRFQQQLQDDTRYQRKDMRRQQQESQAQFDRLFTMLMNNQTAQSQEPSPTKPSPHRKKSRPSDRSPMQPKYLDATMSQVDTTTTKPQPTQTINTQNATPYPTTNMETDTDKSYHETNKDNDIDADTNSILTSSQHQMHDHITQFINKDENTPKTTNKEDNHETMSQANTHYSNRSVTPIEEGDEHELVNPPTSTEQQ
jgi:hypothetical protein